MVFFRYAEFPPNWENNGLLLKSSLQCQTSEGNHEYCIQVCTKICVSSEIFLKCRRPCLAVFCAAVFEIEIAQFILRYENTG